MIKKLVWMYERERIDIAGEKNVPVCSLAIMDDGHLMAVVMMKDGLKLVSSYLPEIRRIWLKYLNDYLYEDEE